MIALASKMYFGVGLAKLNFIEYENLRESINLNEFREIDGIKICDKKFEDLIENKYKLYSSDKEKDMRKLNITPELIDFLLDKLKEKGGGHSTKKIFRFD